MDQREGFKASQREAFVLCRTVCPRYAVSVNLAAEGDLWCELLSSDKYSNPNEYKEKKSSPHYFFESSGSRFQKAISAMKNSIFIFVFLLLCLMMSASVSSQDDFFYADQCRQLEFTPEKAFDGRRLINHVIRTVEVLAMSFCDNMCYMEPDCVSINLYKRVSGDGGYKCELNNVTHERHEHDLERKDHYFYHAAESACVDNPCDNNSTCQSGFTDKGYRCLCNTGFKGPRCKKDVNECADGTSNCSADAMCNNTEGSYCCKCKPGFTGDGRICKDIDECATGKTNCSADAVCNNTKGSFNCTCKRGYYGDGNICRSGNISPAVFLKPVFVLFLSVKITVMRLSSIIIMYIEI
ncbi:uncharacterized protein [Pocillopora verrucosa]|uniref:uncharacterized protein n=1 Tax=Pocillopora verrucosa TaxID=203993 RepID=UPI00333FE9CE